MRVHRSEKQSNGPSELVVTLADCLGLLIEAPGARTLALLVLALEDGGHDHRAEGERADDREGDITDRCLALVAGHPAVQEEPVVHCRCLAHGVLHDLAAIQRLHWPVVAMRESSPEGLPLRHAEVHRGLKDRPLHGLLAARRGVAAVVLEEGPVQCGAKGPHQVHRQSDGGGLADGRDVLRQELLQELALLTEVKQKARDDDVVVSELEHALLVLLDHLQLGGELLAVDHVLGRHVQGHFGHLVELREAVGPNDRRIAHLVTREAQSVAVVLDTET
mmetsp:Transcript_95957/g.309465  ORF Transcript_95957/g.309465 Transcript_95957/m.309465 type:complete len:277 (+) Transcript_95957:32-862(+)